MKNIFFNDHNLLKIALTIYNFVFVSKITLSFLSPNHAAIYDTFYDGVLSFWRITATITLVIWKSADCRAIRICFKY